jgi:hypothetical protein
MLSWIHSYARLCFRARSHVKVLFLCEILSLGLSRLLWEYVEYYVGFHVTESVSLWCLCTNWRLRCVVLAAIHGFLQI